MPVISCKAQVNSGTSHQLTTVTERSKVALNIFINYNFSKHIHQLIISLLDEWRLKFLQIFYCHTGCHILYSYKEQILRNFNYSSKTRVRNEVQIISVPYNAMKKFVCMALSLIHEILLRILSTCHFVIPCRVH